MVIVARALRRALDDDENRFADALIGGHIP